MAKRKTNKLVALVLPIGRVHIDQTSRAILRYAADHGNWRFAVSPDWLTIPLRGLRNWRGDGIIAMVNTRAEARIIAQLALPTVNLSGALAEAGVPRVTVDNHAAGRLAAEHLLQRGFRRFAYYSPRGVWYATQRGAGFCQAVDQAGGTCSIFQGRSSLGSPLVLEEADQRLLDWIGALRRPVGLFACHDYRARLILEACRQLGLHVPDDVAVIGMDDDHFACDFSDPPLTSVSRNGKRVGEEAARLLDRLMSGKAAPAADILVPPDGVVTRRSTDVTAIDDPTVVAAARYMRDHLAEPIGVAEVVKALGISHRGLGKGFHRALGQTPRAYLAQLRVERAKHLLAEQPKLRLALVAERCGFRDAKRLRLVFQRYVGQSPRTYRTQHALPTK